MALQDLLDGIVADAEGRIQAANDAHKQRMSELRAATDRDSAKNLQSIAHQKEQKKVQMVQRSKSQAAMLRRHALLRKKQQMLDKVYDDVITALLALPEEKQQSFLKTCLDRIDTKGVVHPAKTHKGLIEKIATHGRMEIGSPVEARGGFIFRSASEVHDYTYEFIVGELLRSKTELDAVHSLFSRDA